MLGVSGFLPPKAPCRDHIRGYNAKERMLAHASDYWTSVSDELTPQKMTGDRFRQ